MKADIASAVSLLTKQPRALLGQRPAVGTRCTMLNTLNTQTSHSPANSFFVVFYSYDQESTCSDFSFSCDGQSVAQDMGSVSELADHVDVAECSGNTHYGMLFGDIQSKCVGQIHKLTCGFRSSSTRGSTGITTTHLCHKLFAQS